MNVMKSWARIERIVPVVAAVLVAGTASIGAHMKIEKSDPSAAATLTAAPKQVQIWFSQKPDLTLTKIDLQGPAGAVKLAPAHLMGATSVMAAIEGTIADGTYTVRWQSAGDDGHVQKGEYTFKLQRK